MIRVFEAYAITMPLLEQLASTSKEWREAYRFVLAIRGKTLEDLSEFEIAWLQEIELDLKNKHGAQA